MRMSLQQYTFCKIYNGKQIIVGNFEKKEKGTKQYRTNNASGQL